MKKNNKKKKYHLDLIVNLFINIKKCSIDYEKIEFFKSFIEMINNLIILDIIFNRKRYSINYLSYLYFLNPLIYYEILCNKIVKNKYKNYFMLEDEYKSDQMSLLIKKYFNINLYKAKYYNNLIIFKIVFLIINYLFIIILILKSKKIFIKQIKQIICFLIYIIYQPLLFLLCIIFNRNIFIQLSDSFNSIDHLFLINIILLCLFYVNVFFFYTFFLYSFGFNEKYFFYNKKIGIFKIINFTVSCLLYSLKYKNRYSFSIQSIWLLLNIYYIFLKSNCFKYSLYKTLSDYIQTIMELLIICMILTRFITFFLIKYLKYKKLFKIFELLIIFGFLFLFINIYLIKEKYVNLSKINFLIQRKNNNLFIGLYQIFGPFLKVFYIKNNKINKRTENLKEKILKIIQKNFNLYFCSSKNDYEILNEDYQILKNLYEMEINNLYNQKEEIDLKNKNNYSSNDYFQILLHIINYIDKLIENKNDIYFEKLKQILFYYKILLYIFFEKKRFKIEYLLSNYIQSNYFINSIDLIGKCIFGFLSDYLFNKNYIINDNNNNNNNHNYYESLTIFYKMNSNYLKLLKCFKYLINNYSNDIYDLTSITMYQNNIIKNYIKKIIYYKKTTEFNAKLKENIEFEKYRLIEAILLNSKYNKCIELFDIHNIDSLIKKNIYFIILFKKEEYIIKSAPVYYFKNTNIKTLKLKGNSFLSIFPDCLKNNVLKEMKSSIFEEKNNKITSCLETSNKLIIYINFYVIKLPSLNKKLYLACNLEINNINKNNVFIMNKQGEILKYGEIFTNFFGLNYDEKERNIFKLLGIKFFNINYEDNKPQIININYEKISKKINTNLKGKHNNILKFEINEKLKKIKKTLDNSKSFQMKIKIEKNLIFKNETIFIVQLKIDQLTEEAIKKNSILNNDTSSFFDNSIYSSTNKFNSLIDSTTISTLNFFKDKNWNITNLSKKYDQENTINIFNYIYFFYNFFLVLFAILFSIYSKVKIKGFKKNTEDMYNLRLINLNLLYNYFYFTCKLIIINDSYTNNNLYNTYQNVLDYYNLTLNLTKIYHFQNEENVNFIINYYNIKTKPILAHSIHKKLKKFIEEKIILMDVDGSNFSATYSEIFTIQIHYIYVLSNIEEFYLKIPLLTYENKHKIEEEIDDNIKIAYVLVYNFIPIIKLTSKINDEINNVFQDELDSLKIFIIMFLIIFIILNISSLILLKFTTFIQISRIKKIIVEISEIDKNHILYLKEKLKSLKYLIINENKASAVIEHLKYFNSDDNKNKPKLKSQKSIINDMVKRDSIDEKNTNFILENLNSELKKIDKKKTFTKNNNKFINKKENKLIYANLNKKKSNKKTNFKINYAIYNNIISFIILYVFLFGLGIYYLYLYYKKIKNFLSLFCNIQDLQDSLILNFIVHKFLILMNNTLIYEEFGGNQMSNKIYDYFSFVLNKVKETGKKYKNLIDIYNSNQFCNYGLIPTEKNGNFQPLLQACLFFPIFNTFYFTLNSYFINTLNNIYILYEKNEKSFMNLVQLFYLEKFQFAALITMIYPMDSLYYINTNYIKPDLNDTLNSLIRFLIFIFVFMVIFEILNYLISNYLIIKTINDCIKNYNIIHKFFITPPEIKQKQNS